MRQVLLTLAAFAISTAAICTNTTTARAEAEGWYLGGGGPGTTTGHVSFHPQCVHKVRYASCTCVLNHGHIWVVR
ncbi:hypothetical protein ACFFWD_44200 [Bradyrhizobium erythrophlei]|uniref:hypothetical protein n=1 Tax=Bradyrhizobium erythrophlei TaxID=1437360 RepID=UPI0035EAD4B3